MLEIKKIIKKYTTGSFTQTALNKVSLKFRRNEFVAILGPSGSGKTTLLNIIGGLDRYDDGDLIINDKSTKTFNDSQWDAYRNNCVGFVFQSYNLISHISVLSNIEMSLTLSGVSSSERKKRALEVLDRVGLKEHVNKKPNQLSGGQMQRVAIARALINEPDIILADEPTGALDTKTSKQIMKLIKEIAKDKLVIMVTHNSDIAFEYANRIVEMRDGKIITDSNPVDEVTKSEGFDIKRTSMNFLTALKLSFNNIKTKKGRTVLTSLAASIGIIGIALILSLSNGFDIQISKFEQDTLANMPIMISKQSLELDEETMNKFMNPNSNKEGSYPDDNKVLVKDSIVESVSHNNIINKDYVDYVNKIDSDLLLGIGNMRMTNLNIITNDKGLYRPVMFNANFRTVMEMPEKPNSDKFELVNYFYDVIGGELPKDKGDLLLIVDKKNTIDKNILSSLGIDVSKEIIDFDDIIGKELKLILNDEYYESRGNMFTINQDYKNLYESNKSVTLKISGIIRGKKEKNIEVGNDYGLLYTKDLMNFILQDNKDSKIVKEQEIKDYNVLSLETFDINTDIGRTAKENILSYLGGIDTPVMINIYPYDFDSKDSILNYLDKYNESKEQEDKVIYTDLGDMISSLSGNIMSAITIVLIAFSAISLVVSTIMIAIITYISVLERTKEIGILRALGARKKDITRVFNAETFIIGLSSGMLGILIAVILLLPINIIFYNITELKNVAVLNPLHAILLVTISVILTLIGGFIPAKMAAKKDPVIALRTE